MSRISPMCLPFRDSVPPGSPATGPAWSVRRAAHIGQLPDYSRGKGLSSSGGGCLSPGRGA
jgi:hypothetical protein